MSTIEYGPGERIIGVAAGVDYIPVTAARGCWFGRLTGATVVSPVGLGMGELDMRRRRKTEWQ